MDTPPPKMSPDAFSTWLGKERTRRYAKLSGRMVCRKCGVPVVLVACYLSIHYDGWSVCAGGGQVEKLDLEFCPNCEDVPASVSSCVHRPGYSDTFTPLEATNRPEWWDRIRKFFGHSTSD